MTSENPSVEFQPIDYTFELLGDDLHLQEPTPLSFQEEIDVKSRGIGPYAGIRLIRLPPSEVEKLRNGAPDLGQEITKTFGEADTIVALYAGFCIRTRDEKIAIDIVRGLVERTIGKKIPVIFSGKNLGLKPAEDPYFEDIYKFLFTDSNPKVIEKTSFQRFHETIFEAIQKYVLKGKKYQVPKPRSLVNLREILLYDLQRFTLTYVYANRSERVKLYCKYPLENRKVKVTGLHSPDRIRSVLTRDEMETILSDENLKIAWDAQIEKVKKITSGLTTGSLTHVKRYVEDSTTEFCDAVPKQFLRIAYSRMKARNAIIASQKKGKDANRVATPKLSVVLASMLKRNDRFGNPGIAIAALYREDFLSIYERTVDVIVKDGTFSYEWLGDTKSFGQLRDYCRANAQQGLRDDDDVIVPDQ